MTKVCPSMIPYTLQYRTLDLLIGTCEFSIIYFTVGTGNFEFEC